MIARIGSAVAEVLPSGNIRIGLSHLWNVSGRGIARHVGENFFYDVIIERADVGDLMAALERALTEEPTPYPLEPVSCDGCGGEMSVCNCSCGGNFCGCNCHQRQEDWALGRGEFQAKGKNDGTAI